MIAIVAVAAEVALILVGGAARAEAFSWDRIGAHLARSGFGGGVLVVVVVGMAGMLAPLRSWPRQRWTLALAAFLLHLPFVHVPQAQPDTVFWFTLAQHIARDPVATLSQWSAVAWGAEQGRYHHPLPGVPVVYALAYAVFGESHVVSDIVMTLVAVAIPLAVADLGEARSPRTGAAAGWLSLGVPFVAAQSGWMLADLPLLLVVTLAWSGFAHRRNRPAAIVAALLIKPAAVLWLIAPWAFATRRRLWLLAPFVAALWLSPPRSHSVETYLGGIVATVIVLRPSLWVAAAGCLRGDRLDRLVHGGALVLLPLALWAPPDHLARYALPAVSLLAVAGTRLPFALQRGIVASGIAFLLLGYRPIVADTQAANIGAAVRAIEAEGVDSIDVISDMPGTSFTGAALTALVDYEARVPVRFAGALGVGTSQSKRHWWQDWQAPPWASGPPSRGVLLAVYGGNANALAGDADLARIGTISHFRGSSALLPREIVLYRRVR